MPILCAYNKRNYFIERRPLLCIVTIIITEVCALHNFSMKRVVFETAPFFGAVIYF